MERKFIDTNIFLRFLTKDDPSKYDKCKELFKRAMEGKINLATSSLVIADALILYSRENIDYIDSYNAVFMKQNGLNEILSYDSDFDVIDGIKREEP